MAAANNLGPPPPAPKPATKDGGFADSVWQRWFQQLYTAQAGGVFNGNVTFNGLVTFNGSPTMMQLDGHVIAGDALIEGNLHVVGAGSLTVPTGLPGDSNALAASEEFVTRVGIGLNEGSYTSFTIPAQRTSGTSYSNSISPKVLVVLATFFAAGDGVTIKASGTVIAKRIHETAVAGQNTLMAIIPVSATYEVDLIAGATLSNWFELG